MATLKAAAKAKAKANRILSDRKAEMKTISSRIRKAESDAAAAREKLEAATAASDLDAYQNAKADLHRAEDAKEMLKNRLAALKDKPLILKEEYEKLTAEIVAEYTEKDNAACQRLAELADEMNNIGLDLREAIEDANMTLKTLQEEIYKNADRSKHDNGKVLYMSHEDNCIKKYGTIQWATVAVEHSQYNNYNGKDKHIGIIQG